LPVHVGGRDLNWLGTPDLNFAKITVETKETDLAFAGFSVFDVVASSVAACSPPPSPPPPTGATSGTSGTATKNKIKKILFLQKLQME
jgi:hypothetical protein